MRVGWSLQSIENRDFTRKLFAHKDLADAETTTREAFFVSLAPKILSRNNLAINWPERRPQSLGAYGLSCKVFRSKGLAADEFRGLFAAWTRV